MYYSSEDETAPDDAVAEYRREKQKYEALRKQQAKKGTSREDQVTHKLKSIGNALPFNCLEVLLMKPDLITHQKNTTS